MVSRTPRVLGTIERDRGLQHLEESVVASPARLDHPKALAAYGAAFVGSRCGPATTSGYLECVSTKSRILSFGSAGALVVAGALSGALVPGLTGQLLALVLLSVGLGGGVLLVFLEVGLSEDRARAREGASSPTEPRTSARVTRLEHPAWRGFARPPRRPR